MVLISISNSQSIANIHSPSQYYIFCHEEDMAETVKLMGMIQILKTGPVQDHGSRHICFGRQ